ncbi:MAG: MmgE/PrpD family protein [Spirochaetes bacterium]|nr:MmgE/PrpD family protein [Spirochaetota bacterium]
MNESKILTEYVFKTQYSDLPKEAVDVTKMAILDAIGVTLGAGTLGEGCRAFVNLAKAGGGKKESTIIGFNAKVPSYMAAFANGAMAHALDFEDAHEGALVHSNAAAVPAALAVAEALGNVSGKELITAVTLGSDIVCRLGLAFNKNPLDLGWYIPSILGAFGATTAAAKILRLTTEQILDAFSLCLCQATCSAEIINSPHSIIRSIRDSFASKAGVLSAILAKEDIRGFDFPFEGKAGLYSFYSSGDFNSELLLKDIGKEYESAKISFKPWPSCRGTHSYIEATLKIAKEADIGPDDVASIELLVGEQSINRKLCEPLERKRHPKTAIDAKFSIPFTVASALVQGDITLNSFSPHTLTDNRVSSTANKINFTTDNRDWKKSIAGTVSMTLKDGRSISKTINAVYGSPENPISRESLIEKFYSCASYSNKKIPKAELKRLTDMILNLESLDDITNLTEFL